MVRVILDNQYLLCTLCSDIPASRTEHPQTLVNMISTLQYHSSQLNNY